MSKVRYTNKKTGWISIYESTSYYDPVTKTSRPKRKYLGHEDPITGEFIPSSGKAGRKRSTENSPEVSCKKEYKQAIAEIEKLRKENALLESEVRDLKGTIATIKKAANKFLSTIEKQA